MSGPITKIPPRSAILFRDTLVVALLIACPIRLRNLHMMQLGTHLMGVGSDWMLSFEPEETKTHQALILVLTDALYRPLEHFLAEVRPRLARGSEADHVWLTSTGRQLAYNSHYQRIRNRSADLFGVCINPHAFRTIAATHLVESSASDALLARPLLGHRQMTTTEHYYIRASRIEASWKVAQLLQDLSERSQP